MPWGSSGLDFALSLPKPGFYPWSGNQDHGKLHGVAKTKLTNFEKKKIPGSAGSVREGPQGQQDTPVLTCRRITWNELCWVQPQGLCTWGPAEVASPPGHHHPSFHRPLGHQSTNPRACWNTYQNLLTSILPFRKRKPVIKPPKCRKETFPRENESF